MEQRLPDGAALLHHLGPVEPRQLAESVIAVDDGPLHDLSVPYEEAGLCGTGDRWAQPLDHDPDPSGLPAFSPLRSDPSPRQHVQVEGLNRALPFWV